MSAVGDTPLVMPYPEGFARPGRATSSHPPTAEIHCTKTSMVARRVWSGA